MGLGIVNSRHVWNLWAWDSDSRHDVGNLRGPWDSEFSPRRWNFRGPGTSPKLSHFSRDKLPIRCCWTWDVSKTQPFLSGQAPNPLLLLPTAASPLRLPLLLPLAASPLLLPFAAAHCCCQDAHVGQAVHSVRGGASSKVAGITA